MPDRDTTTGWRTLLSQWGKRPAGAAVMTAVLSLAAPGAALAQSRDEQSAPARADLTWSTDSYAAACIGGAELQRAVEGLLERPVFTESASSDMSIEVRVERETATGGWVSTIRRREHGGALVGERVLRSPDADCETLLGPVSLIVAMLVDRQRERVVLRQPPRHEAARKLSWAGGATAGVRVSHGMLPSWAVAPTLATEVIPPGFWPLRLGLTVWAETGEEHDGLGGRFDAWQATIGVAPRFLERGNWHAGGCAAVGLGRLSARGVGMQVAREPSHTWEHIEAGADVGVRVSGPVWLRLEAGAMAPWNRPRFVYTRGDGTVAELHKPSMLVPYAAAGIEARFGP